MGVSIKGNPKFLPWRAGRGQGWLEGKLKAGEGEGEREGEVSLQGRGLGGG